MNNFSRKNQEHVKSSNGLIIIISDANFLIAMAL